VVVGFLSLLGVRSRCSVQGARCGVFARSE
jgi:hypothetical protein